MAKYEIDGISLRIPGKLLSAPLKKALETGRFEGNEADAVRRNLVPGDRVLDLGAGAGFISVLAARIVGGENVTSVEASPGMIDVLQHNLAANGAKAATVLHGAVVPDNHASKNVAFAARAAFWASSIVPDDVAGAHIREVPALRLSELLETHRPSVVIMDVEGIERELCQQGWNECVRLLIMEIHVSKYPPSDLQAMFDGLSRAGFTYYPWGTRGEVVVLQRVGQPGT